jgi:RNA polymerase sigma factor (TIGR02999 family)
MNDEAPLPATISVLIERANSGEPEALDRLFSALYPELHRLARGRLRSNAPLTLLDATSLLHETYLRLQNVGELKVENRAHFLAYASRTMRSIIVDFARRKIASRRGVGVHIDHGTDGPPIVQYGEDEVIRVHDALLELAHADERLARLVEMRYFGGLTEEEIADVLGITGRTVRRHWEKARMLLSLALQ